MFGFFSNFVAIALGWRPWFTCLPQLCSGSFSPFSSIAIPRPILLYYLCITTLQHHIHVPATSCVSDLHCSSAFLISLKVVALDMRCNLRYPFTRISLYFIWFCSDMYVLADSLSHFAESMGSRPWFTSLSIMLCAFKLCLLLISTISWPFYVFYFCISTLYPCSYHYLTVWSPVFFLLPVCINDSGSPW